MSQPTLSLPSSLPQTPPGAVTPSPITLPSVSVGGTPVTLPSVTSSMPTVGSLVSQPLPSTPITQVSAGFPLPPSVPSVTPVSPPVPPSVVSVPLPSGGTMPVALPPSTRPTIRPTRVTPTQVTPMLPTVTSPVVIPRDIKPPVSPTAVPTVPTISTPGVMIPRDVKPPLSPTLPTVRGTPLPLPTVAPSFPVTETPMDALLQVNTPPTFSTPGEVPRTNSVLDELLEEGYVVEHRLYTNGNLTHLLTRTRLGDRVIVKLDETCPVQPRAFSMADVQMEVRSPITVIPQETKVGALRCLSYDICGAAFVCNGNMCVTERTGETEGQTSYTESTYTLTGGTISGARLGRAVMSYPVVTLSALLKDLEDMQDKVATASDELFEFGRDKLREDQDELEEAIDDLERNVQELRSLYNRVQTGLQEDIMRLTQMYQGMEGVSPDDLPDDQQEVYYTVLRGLSQKKEQNTRLLNAMTVTSALTAAVRSLTRQLNENVSPLFEEYLETEGTVE